MNTSERTDKRILIVDTEHFALSGLYRQLRRDGIAVTACDTMEEAVRAVESQAHDLVLIGGGPGDNEDVIKFGMHVRETRPETHVILLTEAAPAKIRRKHGLDVYRFSMKPGGMQGLYEKLQIVRGGKDTKKREKGHS